MYDFAQVLPNGIEGPLCLDYNDQIAALSSLWLILLVTSLVLSGVFIFSGHRKLGIAFAGYFSLLLLTKFLFSSDECGHGGLFSGDKFIVLILLLILVLGTLAFGIYRIMRQKRIKK